jgi:hypothetical protein
MGYPMAINLRAGIDANTKLLICDVSEDALTRFQKDTEGKGPVEVVKNGFEAVQRAVRSLHTYTPSPRHHVVGPVMTTLRLHTSIYRLTLRQPH